VVVVKVIDASVAVSVPTSKVNTVVERHLEHLLHGLHI